MKPGILLVQKSLFRIIYLPAILLLFLSPFAKAQRIIGYFPNYNYSMANASGIQYAKLTHLYYFSLNPTRSVSGQSTGTLWYNDPASWFTTTSFNDVNAKARAANPNIKILIVTGGAPGPTDSDISTRLEYIGSNPGPLNTFCNNIITFIVNNNLDGWDLDWEFPKTASALTAHQNLLAKMRFKIDSLKTTSCKYYEITAAVGGGYTDRIPKVCWNPADTDHITQIAINYLDQINLMTYDGQIGSPPCSFSSHQHYDLVTKAFTDWRTDFTIPASKINIGVGFYDNSKNVYNAIGNVNTRYNSTYWNGGSGCPNMQAKIDYIHAQGGSGTMIWELTQDNLCAGTVPACYSLLDCMYQHTQSTWGTWVAPTVSCTAPVELVSFVGSSTAQGNELSWATASELNNDRFEIERSLDGNNYTTIGSVNGAGNSSSLLNYNFLDASNTAAKTYYRLHQFDVDGKSTYSKTVVVYSVQELTLLASPIPFKDQCSITVAGVKGEDLAQLIIYDLIGNVYANEMINVSNGSYEVGKNLPTGIYICALKSQDKTTHLRIVKTK